MKQIESRLERLERQSPPQKMVMVFIRAGETREQAVRRAGHDPDAQGMQFVFVRWLDAL